MATKKRTGKLSKKENKNIVSGGELIIKLKELGFNDVDEEYLHNVPYGEDGSCNREGLLKNGKVNEYVGYFDLKNSIKFFTELREFDLAGKLKQMDIELDPHTLKYLPFDMVDGKYCYNLDRVVSYLNSINKHNLKAKLKERGYEIDDDYAEEISGHLYLIKNAGSGNELDRIIEYINSVNNYNLKDKLKEQGYDSDEIYINRILREDHMRKYENGLMSYDIDKIIEFIKEHPFKNKVTNMNNATEEERYYGNNTESFYGEAPNVYSRFPISKWYCEKYKTIPDITFLGYIYIDDLLDEYKKNIKWYFKNLSYCDDPTEFLCPPMLRGLEDEQLLETIVEALIEIEDGMFVLLTDGRFNSEKCEMYATAILFYKEGIHDPTDILNYVSDKFVLHDESGTLGLLFHDGRGFGTQDFTIPKPTVDFNLHYNEGFEKVHNTIYSALCKEKGKGLVLLHGKPGTGKTTYIRYLINMLNKNKIFVPPNLTEMLSDPGFIPFLVNNSDCVLFVEDAENVLRSREDGHNNQAVSNILNITDGLLSDCLNIQIVATFNTNLKNIDEALLRKGRLISQYEFKELEPARAEKLADSLKVWLDDTSRITLADIYAAQAKQESEK